MRMVMILFARGVILALIDAALFWAEKRPNEWPSRGSDSDQSQPLLLVVSRLLFDPSRSFRPPVMS